MQLKYAHLKRIMNRKLIIIFLCICSIFLILSACSSAVDNTAYIKIPVEQIPILEDNMDQTNTETVNGKKALNITTYFDATLSMKGFVEPKDSYYKQSIIALVDSMPLLGPQSFNIMVFGRDTKPIEKSATILCDPNYYDSLLEGKTETEDFSETNISEIFSNYYQSNLEKRELCVLITDLFESEKDITNTTKELGRLIQEGKTVGIMAIKSQFDGTIYDVGPNQCSFFYKSDAEIDSFRPFYVFVIGDGKDVQNYMQQAENQLNIGELDSEFYHKIIFAKETEQDLMCRIPRIDTEKGKVEFQPKILEETEVISAVPPENLIEYTEETMGIFEESMETSIQQQIFKISKISLYQLDINVTVPKTGEEKRESIAYKWEVSNIMTPTTIELEETDSDNASQQQVVMKSQDILKKQLNQQVGEESTEITDVALCLKDQDIEKNVPYYIVLKLNAIVSPLEKGPENADFMDTDWVKQWDMDRTQLTWWEEHPQDFLGNTTLRLNPFVDSLKATCQNFSKEKLEYNIGNIEFAFMQCK